MTALMPTGPVELVRRHLSAEDQHDLDAAMAPFSEEPCYEIPSLGISLRGRDEIAKHHSDLFAAFPDLRNTHVSCYEADDRVFARIRVERTHLGAWGPFAPTGRHVITEALAEFPVAADGRLQAEIVHTNPLHALQQIGAVPSANAFELAQAFVKLRGAG